MWRPPYSCRLCRDDLSRTTLVVVHSPGATRAFHSSENSPAACEPSNNRATTRPEMS